MTAPPGRTASLCVALRIRIKIALSAYPSVGQVGTLYIINTFQKETVEMNTVTLHVGNNTTVWQCACGMVSQGKDYSKVCFDHDAIMIGPGTVQPYHKCLTSPMPKDVDALRNDVPSARIFLRKIAEEILDGDIVVLRYGKSTIRGVGVVVGGYVYCPAFGDGRFSEIGHWRVPHSRHVRWLWKGFKNFDTPLLPMCRLSKIDDGRVHDWLRGLEFTNADMNRQLRPLPE